MVLCSPTCRGCGWAAVCRRVRSLTARRMANRARRGRRVRLRHADAASRCLPRQHPSTPQGLKGTLSNGWTQGRVRRELEWVRIEGGGAPMAARRRRHCRPRPIGGSAKSRELGLPPIRQDRWPRTPPAHFSRRRVSPSSRAISCAAVASSTWWLAGDPRVIAEGARAPATFMAARPPVSATPKQRRATRPGLSPAAPPGSSRQCRVRFDARIVRDGRGPRMAQARIRRPQRKWQRDCDWRCRRVLHTFESIARPAGERFLGLEEPQPRGVRSRRTHSAASRVS